MIRITVEDKKGNVQVIEIPEGINLNLMETLKAYEYNVRATCGGMGLCADCHCEVLDGEEKLLQVDGQEAITLDSIPDAKPASRLACQIRLQPELDGLSIRLLGEIE